MEFFLKCNDLRKMSYFNEMCGLEGRYHSHRVTNLPHSTLYHTLQVTNRPIELVPEINFDDM